jgi:hypothetical protein
MPESNGGRKKEEENVRLDLKLGIPFWAIARRRMMRMDVHYLLNFPSLPSLVSSMLGLGYRWSLDRGVSCGV